MRGLLLSTFCNSRRERITPADAGTTKKGAFCPCYCRDHPRGCGDYSLSFLSSSSLCGSPPRMRGLLLKPTSDKARARITPADAGTTIIAILYGRTYEDHPRGCGDYRFTRKSEMLDGGSPPRMRGLRFGREMVRKKCQDHPRGCGDYARDSKDVRDRTGSPPRMRGLPYKIALGHKKGRITPADAGTTV